MTRSDQGRPRRRAGRRRPARSFRAAARGFAAATAWLLLTAFAASAAPVHVYDLGNGVGATVRSDGAVVLAPAAPGATPLLTTSPLLPPLNPLRRSTAHGTTFTGLYREGEACGHRGLSRLSDDDNDGRTDEDRPDGVDNDGDGLVDEDYATVGDLMAVVSRLRGERAAHLQVYHWNYPHLRGLLFLSRTTDDPEGAPREDDFSLDLAGGAWREGDVNWTAPDLKAGGAAPASHPMYASRAEAPDGSPLWLGMTVFSTGSGTHAVPTLEAHGITLQQRGELLVALAVAPTPTRLHAMLAAAWAVRIGAPPQPGAEAVPWIVSVPAPPCRDGAPLSARWVARDDGGWRLAIDVPGGCDPLLDPDSFHADGVPVGAPATVSWRAAKASTGQRGGAWTERWPDPDESSRTPATAPHPYMAHLTDLLGAAGGVLSFDYPGLPAPPSALRIDGSTAGGLPVRLKLQEPVADASGEAADVAEIISDQESQDQPPTLAPELLENYPNPFREQTNLRYTVPTTVGEGLSFPGDPPAGLKASDPMPYTSGSPHVSLKIYTVAGHEVVTVFDENCDQGSYTTSWNGCDATGRPVAAGTYFCKLQIEKWSVTKRVVLLR